MKLFAFQKIIVIEQILGHCMLMLTGLTQILLQELNFSSTINAMVPSTILSIVLGLVQLLLACGKLSSELVLLFIGAALNGLSRLLVT